MSDKQVPTIKLQFHWTAFTPDHRQWKPSNPIVEAGYTVEIIVPLTPDLIINATKIAAAQLTNQKEEVPILTPLGMRYCIDQFEQAMSDTKQDESEEKEDTSSWDDSDEESAPTGKVKSTEKSDDWDDENTNDTDKKDDENWDENWED